MTNASLYKLVFIISCLFMVIILDCAMKMAADKFSLFKSSKVRTAMSYLIAVSAFFAESNIFLS